MHAHVLSCAFSCEDVNVHAFLLFFYIGNWITSVNVWVEVKKKNKKKLFLTTVLLADLVSVTAEHKYIGVVPHPGVGGVVV